MELDWQKYIAVAERFQHKARYQDREDLRQSIILRLAEVERNNGHKPFTEAAMYRVASFVVMEYWRTEKRNSLISLNSEVDNGEGDSIELIDTLADDDAIDLAEWVDAKTWLRGCPRRLIEVAHKRVRGIPLDGDSQRYLNRYQKQLKLVVQDVRF
jgi:hypothetical protein